MADSKERSYTLVKTADFNRFMELANDVIDAVEKMGVPPISAGFAGVSLIRACIALTDGDMEWWVKLLREGPDSIVAIPMPPGANTLGKGPAGKQ